ncbi:hypothetical protein ACROYT_G026461 [Oculina patagonica]
MICGSLMAVANGLIPSLGAMIYGKLTDELVIRENWNCTLNESITTVRLKNLVTLEMIQPRLKGINATKTKSIEVTVNETGILVKVVGLNGKLLNETVFEEKNATKSVILNGTSLNGTQLTGIDVTGTRVDAVKLKGRAFVKKKDEAKDRKGAKTSGNETIGHVDKGNHQMSSHAMQDGKENHLSAGKESHSSVVDMKRTAEDFNNVSKVANMKEEFLEKVFVGSLKKRSQMRSWEESSFQSKKSENVLNEKYFRSIRMDRRDMRKLNSVEQHYTEQRKANREVKREISKKENPKLNLTDGRSIPTGIKTQRNFSDDSISIGQVQTIKMPLTTPTPKVLPETNNINYTLRNITESCHLFKNRIEDNMSKYAFYYVYAAIGTLLFALGQNVMWNIASERAVKNLSENLTDSMLDKDPGFYDTKIYEGAINLEGITDPREAISQHDLDALSGGLGGEIAYLIQSVSSVMSGFLVSFIENWKITLVMMTAGPVLAIIQGIADKVEKFVMKQKEELKKRASQMAKKSLGSIKTVASYAGEKIEKTRYSGKVEATNNLNKLKSLILGIQKGLSTVVTFSFLGLGFWYSSTLLPGGSVTPGALMTIFMAIISGVMQMAGTGEQMDDVGDARTALSSLFGVSESGDDDPFDQAASQLDTVFGKLDVFNVYFHYPSRPEYQILKSINFTVEEGQTVALLGDKGSGKSALIKLLQRIYDPQTGKVRLDGQDVRFLDRRWFRRQVGIVHKKPDFFNTSIADNIAYGKDEASLKDIVRAAKAAGAHEFITALPKGYATVLYDDGSPLTSYQKHLLALARAMIRKPRILLWEEDLSIMDSSAFNALTNYLDKARRGRTTVISTSHVSVARIADVIIVLHNGEIIEQGGPEELMLSGGAFRYLATLQYFESQSVHQERLLKTIPVPPELPPVKDGIEELESSLNQTQEEAKEQVKGFISKARQMLQDKLNEGKSAYKVIWMQLQDLPLLLAGALGAAITGMVAPGLSFLFGEIQKFMNDPLRVAREGPFWSSMFVVLGVVVGFGGTIEKFMLSFATERLRTRMQKMAFDTAINKNSVPQIPGMGGASTSFPGAGGQFPGLPHPTGMGLPAVPGVPTAQFPSIGGVPTGMAGLPSGQMPVSGLPGIGSTTPGLPSGIPSAQGLPGMTSSGLSGLGGISPGLQTPGLPSGGFPTGIPTPGLTPQELSSSLGTAQGLPGLTTSSIPSGIAGIGTGQLPLPGFAASGGPSAMGPSTLGLPSILVPSPGIPGVSLPGLPSGISSDPGLPQIPGNIPSGPSPQGLGLGQGLPNLPSQPSQSGITGVGLGHGRLPIGAQDSSFGGGGGSIPQIPGMGTGLPTTLPQVNAGQAPSLSQVPGMPTSLSSVEGMAPPSSALNVPGTPGLGEGGYGATIPGSQVNPGMVPPVLSQVPAIPTDMASAGGMVPVSTALGTPGLGGGGFPGSQVNSGMVPQGGLLPGSTAMPTQYSGDTIVSPYAGAVDEMGAQQIQRMGLPPNMPNPDLLVLPDPQKQADQLMSQVEKDVEAALQNSIGKYLGTKVQETISSVSTLGMALYNGWKMTLVVLAGLPIIGLANRIQQNEADATVEPEGVEALMKTSFKKMETISALGVENKFAKKYKDAIFEKYKHALKKILASGLAFALGQATVFFIYAGALRFGCYLISIGDMAAIEVLGVLMTVLFGSYATASSRAPPHAHEDAEESVNRLFEDEATNVDHVGDKLDKVEGSLEFKHVELPDPLNNGASLLCQLKVKVSCGQTLAIVPLDNEKINPFELLLERFFDPVKGTLLLDGVDIRSLDLSWLRSHHAVVSHRSFLPYCSIAENIAYGDNSREVTRREIEDAAYSAYAHEFITNLPKGYDTVPDEDQIHLTESQKTRIAIARAIIRGPPIIVLDELEEEDQAVNDATHILTGNRTCLIFTRRRQTIEAADQIVLMYRGHVVEQGTLDELREQRRLYYLLTNLEAVEEL